MKTSTVVIVLLLVIAAAVAISMDGDTAPSETQDIVPVGARLLGDELSAQLNDVDELVVRTVDGDVTLDRASDSEWTVQELHNYPANFEAVKAALVGASEFKIVDRKTARADRFDRLGVQDVDLARAANELGTLDTSAPDERPTELHIKKSGELLGALIVGKRGAGRTERYARVISDHGVGGEFSWLVKGAISIAPDVKAWVDTAIADVPATRLASVSTVHADGEIVEVSRADEDTTEWTVDSLPENYELVYEGVGRTSANGVASLSFEHVRPGGIDDMTTADRTTTTYRTFDGLVLSITTAPVPVAEGAEATSSGVEAVIDVSTRDDTDDAIRSEAEALAATMDGWVFTLPSWKGDAMRKRLADLATPAPEPKPVDEGDASGEASDDVPEATEALPVGESEGDDGGDGR